MFSARLTSWRSVAAMALVLIPSLVIAQPPEDPSDGPSLSVLQHWQIDNNAGWRFLNKQDYARAAERFSRAIEKLAPFHSTSQRLLARSYNDLARALYYQGRFAEAEPLAQWALTARENHPKSTRESIFESLYTLGVIERAQRNFASARKHFERALALQEHSVSADNPVLAMTLEELAYIDREDGKLAKAEERYKRALAIREKQKVPYDLDLADTIDNYAQLMIKDGRAGEARHWQDRARAIRDDAVRYDREEAERKAAKGFRGFK
jgi:tetratricopeptide (TPR) repeat protein